LNGLHGLDILATEANVGYWKRSNHNSNGSRHDKMALRTTCIKNVEIKVIKIRTGCQCVGCFY